MQHVTPQLHTILLAILPAVDALRSTIAKVAMALLVEMTHALGKGPLDPELDYFIPMLCKKAGEKTFLSEEADKVKAVQVEHIRLTLG